MKKRILWITVTLLVAAITLQHSVTLEKTSARSSSASTLTKELKQRISAETRSFSESEIVAYSIKTTAKELSFSKKNNIQNGKANCIGYSRLCADICNYAFKVNERTGCKATPVVGQVYVCGVNLCTVAKFVVPKQYKGFVSDHDFVQIQLKGERPYYVDACFYDYIFNDCKTEDR